MFSLEKKYLDFILKTLNENIKNAKFFVFGSRAKGNYKQYSDIDIAIQADYEIPIDVLDKVRSIFNNSTLPIEVDIVDLNSIEDNFKNIIKDSLIELKNPLF